MKKHHILIVIVLAVCIGIIISSTTSGNEYADFNYASQHEDKECTVIGNKMVAGDSLFSLYPFIQRNEKFGNVSEPDTRHYLTHDVFTYVRKRCLRRSKDHFPRPKQIQNVNDINFTEFLPTAFCQCHRHAFGNANLIFDNMLVSFVSWAPIGKSYHFVMVPHPSIST